LTRIFLLVALWVLTTTKTTTNTCTVEASLASDNDDFPERKEHQVVQQDNENAREDHQEEQEEGSTVELLDQEPDSDEEEEEEGEQEPLKESSSLVKEREIYVLSTLDSIDQLIELSKQEEVVQGRYPPLSLIFLHNRSCPHSMKLLHTLEQAIMLLHVDIDLLQVYDPHWTVPVVGKMEVDDLYQTAQAMGIPKLEVDQVLALFHVTSVPKLVFLKDIIVGEAEPTTPIQQDHDGEEDDETNTMLPAQFLMLGTLVCNRIHRILPMVSGITFIVYNLDIRNQFMQHVEWRRERGESC
jgi:hypothetical protein